MNPLREKSYQNLVDSCKEAVQRSRSIFLVLNLATLIIITSTVNGAISWLYSVEARLVKYEKPFVQDMGIENYKLKVEIVNQLLHKELEIVSVPIIGLKFSLADMSVLGSIALVIIGNWYFFSVRRENHVVNEIVDLINRIPNNLKVKKDVVFFMYTGIVHLFVFLTTTENDSIDNEKREVPRRVIIVLISAIYWLPMLLLTYDIFTMLMPTDFGESKKTLIEYFGAKEWLIILIRAIIVTAISVFGIKLYTSIKGFSENTILKLKELKDLREKFEG